MTLTNKTIDFDKSPTDLDLTRGTITDNCEFYNPLNGAKGSCRLNQTYVSAESCINKNSCLIYIDKMGELSS